MSVTGFLKAGGQAYSGVSSMASRLVPSVLTDPSTAPRAIRGLMVNLPAGLALAFQFNPSEVFFSKSNNYDIDTPVGFNGPIVTWVSGREKNIKFSLVYDATEGSVDRQIPIGNVGPGQTVEPQIAVLDSFQAPRNPEGALLGLQTVQVPPPDCYFILGTRFWRCKLMRADRKEILFDKLMRPVRLTVEIELMVVENGLIQTIELAMRRAQTVSVSNAANTLGTAIMLF